MAQGGIVDFASIQSAHVLKECGHGKTPRVACEDDETLGPRLGGTRQHDSTNNQLNQKNRYSLRCELPSKPLKENQGHEDRKTEGVVHASGANERRQRGCDAFLALL